MDVGLSPGDFVLDGEPVPAPRQGGGAPPPKKKSAHVNCGQTAGCIKMPLGMEIGLGVRERHCVGCGPSSPRKKGTPTPTQFLIHVYCGQMAGWMKKPLGTEVDLGSGHIVLDGSQLPRKRHSLPSFGPMSIVATVAHLSYCWALVPRSFILSLKSTISWSSHDWLARDQQLTQSTRLDSWWRVRLC